MPQFVRSIGDEHLILYLSELKFVGVFFLLKHTVVQFYVHVCTFGSPNLTSLLNFIMERKAAHVSCLVLVYLFS